MNKLCIYVICIIEIRTFTKMPFIVKNLSDAEKQTFAYELKRGEFYYKRSTLIQRIINLQKSKSDDHMLPIYLDQLRILEHRFADIPEPPPTEPVNNESSASLTEWMEWHDREIDRLSTGTSLYHDKNLPATEYLLRNDWKVNNHYIILEKETQRKQLAKLFNNLSKNADKM